MVAATVPSSAIKERDASLNDQYGAFTAAWLSIADVEALTGIGRGTIKNMLKTGAFPLPTGGTPEYRKWRRGIVIDWHKQFLASPPPTRQNRGTGAPKSNKTGRFTKKPK